MTTVFARTTPTDLRAGYNGLYALVRREHGREPAVGERYLFTNARRKSCKVLERDENGIRILMKRLDRGKFAPLWLREQNGEVRLSSLELDLYLTGCQEVGYKQFHGARSTPSNS